jgi:mannose-1-phosphate guanylyltransferase
MKAVILCGGLGKRLRPLTNKIPKSMIPIGGKPILQHQIEFFRKFGVKEMHLCTSYKHSVIEKYFGDGSKFGVRISYCMDKDQRGTAGSIERLKEVISNDFFLINGDTVAPDLDLMKLKRFHDKSKRIATIVLVHPTSPWGIVEVKDDLVKSFIEKPKLPQLMNMGLYLMTPKIFSMIPRKGSMEHEVFPRLAIKKQLAAFVYEGIWKDFETLKDIEEFDKLYK